MARKLNLEENRFFKQVIENHNSTAIEISSESLLESLAAKRETALDLSPELSAWFGEDVSSLPQ